MRQIQRAAFFAAGIITIAVGYLIVKSSYEPWHKALYIEYSRTAMKFAIGLLTVGFGLMIIRSFK